MRSYLIISLVLLAFGALSLGCSAEDWDPTTQEAAQAGSVAVKAQAVTAEECTGLGVCDECTEAACPDAGPLEIPCRHCAALFEESKPKPVPEEPAPEHGVEVEDTYVDEDGCPDEEPRRPAFEVIPVAPANPRG